MSCERALFLYVISVFFLSTSHIVRENTMKAFLKILGYLSLSTTITLLYYSNLVDVYSLQLGQYFTLVSSIISLYTLSYSRLLRYPRSLEVVMDIFLLAITSTYIAPSLMLMVFAWTISEIIGYILIRIGEEHSFEGSLTSSRGFIFTSTLTYETSVFTLVAMSMVLTAGSIGVYELIEPYTAPRKTLIPVPLFIIPLLLVGFLAKIANIPLHFWLPSAHSSAPSPASAALSGLMVSMGYYGLIRVLGFIDISNYNTQLAWLFLVIGLLSTIYGGLQALRQRDVKRLLAYSTIATNGFISVLFSMYLITPSDLALWIMVIAIIMHAAYKTTLFCETGLIEAVYGTRYIHGVRGFIEIAPLSTIGGILAISTLLGVPGSIGFVAKLLAVFNSIGNFNTYPLFFATTLFTILIHIITSTLIGLRYARIYHGSPTWRTERPRIDLGKYPQLAIISLGSLNILSSLLPLFIPNTSEYGLLFAVPIPLVFLVVVLVYHHLKIRSIRGEISA